MKKIFIFSLCMQILFSTYSFAVEKSQKASSPSPPSPPLGLATDNMDTWEKLENGIDYLYKEESLVFPYSQNSMLNEEFTERNVKFQVHFIRIDPKKYNIRLYGSFLEEEKKSLTISQWAEKKNLALAINASMYLPNGRTSTGYMRSGEQVNNKHIMEKMDGFFLAKPHNKNNKNLDDAIFIEKSHTAWREQLKNYEIVVQNFRVLGKYTKENPQAMNMWEHDGSRNSISVYGNDVNGNIYFIFSQRPTSIHELATYLLNFAYLNNKKTIVFKTILYAEGGSEAGLFVDTQKRKFLLSGWGVKNFFNFTLPIPNILGIEKK